MFHRPHQQHCHNHRRRLRANLDALISTLVNDFVAAPTPNHRKGGLIGLAAVTVALAGAADPNLHAIVPPVLRCFTDADQRVRYYACEALYNIAKAQRGVFVAHFAESSTDLRNSKHRLLCE